MQAWTWVGVGALALSVGLGAKALFFGEPADPKVLVAQWATDEKAQLPRQINDRLRQVDVASKWDETGGEYGRPARYWRETYELTGHVEKADFEAATRAAVERICASEVHRGLFAQEFSIELRIDHVDGPHVWTPRITQDDCPPTSAR